MHRFLALMILLSACGQLDNQISGAEGESVAALSATRANGLWIYSPGAWIGNTTQVNALISLMLKQGVSQVYLSTNFALLESADLPGFIQRMSNNGFLVEALIGKAEWGTQSGRADMLSQIARVLAYNTAQTYAQRFKSLHLDVEPWIGTNTDTSWVTPLTNSYIVAKAALAGTGVYLSVDLCGSKVATLPLTQRKALFAAADKLVLMQYEASFTDALSRTERFMSGLTGVGSIVAAVRAEDFPQPYQAVASINATLSPNKLYAGWALYNYDEL
jgi:hypothetical protein